jgi:hypothetical protein
MLGREKREKCDMVRAWLHPSALVFFLVGSVSFRLFQVAKNGQRALRTPK